jgi:riboflavin biosynthesis pyrimidine reductase
MSDTEPQTAGGKVLWHFTMSLDGFVAGPNHEMDWTTGISSRPGLVEEYVETTGAVLGGRDCGPAEAVRIGLAAAGGKNLEVFSPTIGRQLLELGLIDEIDLHIAPVLLGEGIRLYDNPGSEPIRLHRVGEGDPTSAVNVRYRPTTTAKIPTERVSGS